MGVTLLAVLQLIGWMGALSVTMAGWLVFFADKEVVGDSRLDPANYPQLGIFVGILVAVAISVSSAISNALSNDVRRRRWFIRIRNSPNPSSASASLTAAHSSASTTGEVDPSESTSHW